MRAVSCAFLFGAAVASADEKAEEVKKLEGTWESVAVSAGGKEMPKEGLPKKLPIKDGKLTGFGPGMTLATDATKTPKWLEMTFTRDGKTFAGHGIYELPGDSLRICFPLAPTRGEVLESRRPEGFDAKDKPEMLLKLKAVK